MPRVVVLGGGESGRGVALLAQAEGYAVRVSDAGALSADAKTELAEAGIAYEEGGHTGLDDLDAATVVVKSPGIPWEAPFVASAKTRGATVLGEMEFCARYAPERHAALRRIGITGSNGKTTTTLLTDHLLRAAGLRSVAAGNVGLSYARVLLSPTRYEWVVLELSSFQLEDIEDFRVSLGAVLNLSPDHLDRYGGDFAAYAAAKYRLKPRAGLWLQAGDEVAKAHDPGPNGDLTQVELPAVFRPGFAEAPWGEVSLADTALHGAHNAANASFALFFAEAAVALSRGAEAAAPARPVLAEALTTFRNAPHRLEDVGYAGGVRFVNDSKATNLDAVVQAVGAFGNAPLVLVLGGQDKGNDYALIDGSLARVPLRAVVAMGVDNAKILAHYRDRGIPVHDTHALTDALAKSVMEARPGDVVLLSPACASFDLFRDYVDRGDQFRAAVRALPGWRETL